MRTSQPSFRPEEVDDLDRANEALARWDELDERTRAAIAASPQLAPRVSMVEALDRWMAAKTPVSEREPEGCPSADELYDFGRGPGYLPLANARRGEIDRHLEGCRQCELLVETLASPPPVPLDLRGLEEPVPLAPRPMAAPVPTLVTSRTRRAWIPIAVAAAGLVAAATWLWTPVGAPGRFAEPPLLRGSAAGPLLYPRERVLATTPETRAAWPALARGLGFEVDLPEGAEGCEIELLRHDGGAFAVGEHVLTARGVAPMAKGLGVVDAAEAAALPAGRYTWRLSARIHGLDQPLGARDFEVQERPELEHALNELARRSEPERSLAAASLLDQHGFQGDARRLLRLLPPSPERDAYLGRSPGR